MAQVQIGTVEMNAAGKVVFRGTVDVVAAEVEIWPEVFGQIAAAHPLYAGTTPLQMVAEAMAATVAQAAVPATAAALVGQSATVAAVAPQPVSGGGAAVAAARPMQAPLPQAPLPQAVTPDVRARAPWWAFWRWGRR